MVARLLVSGLALGSMALAMAGLLLTAVAGAANPSTYAAAAVSKRVLRPAVHAQSARWMPRDQRVSRRGQATALGPVQRAGARKAVPVTRGQELGLRFRPDERESPYGQPLVPPAGAGTQSYAPALQSQFRPMATRRKPTYEELQAEEMPAQPPLGPIMPYPMVAPPPMPPYGGTGWPEW